MFDLYIDFDAIRERAYDYVQFATGAVQDFVDDSLDYLEEVVDKVNEFGNGGDKVVFDIETSDFGRR
jgi:hypothetical protein